MILNESSRFNRHDLQKRESYFTNGKLQNTTVLLKKQDFFVGIAKATIRNSL